MPGSRAEISNAKSEGVEFIFNQQPTAIIHKNNRCVGVKIALTTIENNGKLKIWHERKNEISCDKLIVAFGFNPSPALWFGDFNIRVADDGKTLLSSSSLSFQTDNPKVFAGGDMVRGADLVVTAVFDGRQAALDILTYMQV